MDEGWNEEGATTGALAAASLSSSTPTDTDSAQSSRSDDPPDPPLFQALVNICGYSVSDFRCRDASASVCLLNLTSLSSHPYNETWPTDRIIAGRKDISPVPTTTMIDEDDPYAGVVIEYRNGLPWDRPPVALIRLECDPAIDGGGGLPPSLHNIDDGNNDRPFHQSLNLTTGMIANVTGASYNLDSRSLHFTLRSSSACPTFVPSPPFRLSELQLGLVIGGSVLSAYIIFGCIYRSVIKGTPNGIQSCPNYETWAWMGRKVRFYMSTCCSFVCNGCRRDPDVYGEL